MFKFVKNIIKDYKQYKSEKDEDTLLVKQSILERDAENEQDDIRYEKIISENISYDEKSDMYHFEVSLYHNGNPRVFSCDEDTKEDCERVARWIMLQGRIYEASGC